MRQIINNGMSLLLVGLSILVSGCSKGNDGPVPPKPPEPERKELIFNDLAKSSIWIGDERDVSIVTAGDFYITPIDNTIATVRITGGKSFRVIAKGVGQTSVTIMDENENTYSYNIAVKDYLTGEWLDSPANFKFELEVTDEATKNAIADELGPKMMPFVDATYVFDNTKKTFKTYGTKPISGSYTFDIYSKKMELVYNSSMDTFIVFTEPTFGRVLTLVEDKTEYYQRMYPNKGVIKVSFSRKIYERRYEFE